MEMFKFSFMGDVALLLLTVLEVMCGRAESFDYEKLLWLEKPTQSLFQQCFLDSISFSIIHW